MTLCPVCNAFETIEKPCPKCDESLTDGGRVADYFDPYAHYNDIETSNQGDGIVSDSSNPQCSHLLYCDHCNYDEVYEVEETPL